MPADAKRIGSAQQAATPNAAAIPARVSAAVLIPLGGLGVWVTGDSLWRACSYPTICSEYRPKRYFADCRNRRGPDRRTIAPAQLQTPAAPESDEKGKRG